MSESFAGHCEVAQRLAARLGFGESLIVCLGQIYERWDGKGLPRKLKGDQVALGRPAGDAGAGRRRLEPHRRPRGGRGHRPQAQRRRLPAAAGGALL